MPRSLAKKPTQPIGSTSKQGDTNSSATSESNDTKTGAGMSNSDFRSMLLKK